MRSSYKPFFLLDETERAKAYLDLVFNDLVKEKIITKRDAGMKPNIYMLAANTNPNPVYSNSLPIAGSHGDGGFYNPNTNEIVLPVSMVARVENKPYQYPEYKAYKSSLLCGAVDNCSEDTFIKLGILHELAHWFDEVIFKSEKLLHTSKFRVTYSFLRLAYLDKPY